MVERATYDRILRDPDDVSGQTVRQWSVQAEAGRVVIRDAAGDDGRYCIGMRPGDVESFCTDLDRARTFAMEVGNDGRADDPPPLTARKMLAFDFDRIRRTFFSHRATIKGSDVTALFEHIMWLESNCPTPERAAPGSEDGGK